MGPIGKSGTLRITLVVLAAFAALTLTTCGGKKRHAPPTLPWLTSDTEAQALQAEKPRGADRQNTLTERLTAALQDALEARGGKVAAAPPTGDGNLIVDLDYIAGGIGGNRLVWHYRNLGDYDQNGTVSLGDITPLAMHFGETIAENPLVEVIDGDLDGAAGIGDVQAIADNYGSTVARYIVESAIEEHGEYAEVGSVEFAAAMGGDAGWKDLTFSLPTGDALWYRVVPVDEEGARGIASLPVQFRLASAAPRVTEVSPLTGEPDDAVRFTATVEGEEPFSYYWYFGDMGTPSSSTDAEPLVVLLELGRHVCRVRVSNAHGQHTYFFAVLVTPSVYPPFIEWVQPTSAVANTQVQFYAQVHGTEPMEYHWNFGGGAAPNETSDPWPTMTVGGEGNYECWLSVSNSAGTNNYGFTLDVHPGPIGDWHMFGHDAQHTGRSPYVGAQDAVLKWQYKMDSSVESSPAIGPDGTIYVGNVDSNLYAINPDGTLKWRYRTGRGVRSSPAIGADGTVYVGSNDDYLYAITSDGNLKWRYETGDNVSSSPAIGVDGTVYVGSDDNYIYSINPDGTLLWRYETGGSVQSSPALGSDGTVYAGSDDGYLYAINPDGALRWSYKANDRILSSPAIGIDGTVYVWSFIFTGYYPYHGYLYAINADGALKWRYRIRDAVWSSPAIGSDGTIYLGSGDNNLYAIGSDGTLNWRYETGGNVDSSPAIGADGTIYIGSRGGYFYAINPNGTLRWRWRYETGWHGAEYSSPAIGADGTTYVGFTDLYSNNGYLCAFNSESAPVISSVSPTVRMAGSATIFTAEVRGAPPLSYYWDFSGGAWPNMSNDPSPEVTLSESGVYDSRLTVTNSYGADTYRFELTSVGLTPPGDWHMFGRNPTHSHRSPYVGAQTSSLRWQYRCGRGDSSPAICADGTVYVGGRYGLDAVNPDGTFKWRYETKKGVDSSPAIGADGTVYVGSSDDLCAIKPDGILKWRYDTGDSVRSSPAIGADGTIYVGSRNNYLYALYPDGTLKWRYETASSVISSPMIGSDGTVYVGCSSTSYWVGGYLYALNHDGTLKWRYETDGSVYSSPAIGADGTIYVGSYDNHLYAIKSDGTLNWRYETGGLVHSSPAIGDDGTVYVGSVDNYLYALNPDGTLKWRFETGDDIYSSPAIGADDTAYIGSYDNWIYALDADGKLKWRYETDNDVYSSPAVGENGAVYIGSRDGCLYAFCDSVDGTPPAISSVNRLPASNLCTGYKATFFTDISGAPPITYSWNFGDGAIPDVSTEASPTVTMGDPGEYDAWLTVSNDYGEDTFAFTLSVHEIGPGDWRMFGREPAHNRRSPYVGTQTGSFKWQLRVVYYYIDSSPAIGADGTIYVGSHNILYAINSNGTLNWQYRTYDRVDSSPAIGVDGIIYVGSRDKHLYALNPDGTLKWRYETGDDVYSSPAIGADETIYVGSYDDFLYAINPDGTFQWRYETGGNVYSSPAIGADGTIYVGSCDDYLYALNPDGTLKWRYETWDSVMSSPAIGADGTIYVGSCDKHLYALNPDGTLKWRYRISHIIGTWVMSSPAIGADGTIYVGSGDCYLYAINPDGTLNWRYETGGDVNSSPAIGADGTIYVGSNDNYIYAINPDGPLKWRYETGWEVRSSPAIGEDGTVYVGSYDGYLYAFGD